MKRTFRYFTFLAIFCLPNLVFAQDLPFKQHNPDIDKYFFAKNFIVGLSYYNRVALRLKEEEKKESLPESDIKAIGKIIENRTLDNTELRIAKNYITRFENSQNPLIKKVENKAVVAYEELLNFSVRERDLWQSLYRFKVLGQPKDFDEEEFGRQQILLARDKKEVAKGLLEASLLLKTVLLSAEHCPSEDCKILALTQEERGKLVEKLDSFARDNMDWGIKAGQSTIQACVSGIREVLEDTVYQSKDK